MFSTKHEMFVARGIAADKYFASWDTLTEANRTHCLALSRLLLDGVKTMIHEDLTAAQEAFYAPDQDQQPHR